LCKKTAHQKVSATLSLCVLAVAFGGTRDAMSTIALEVPGIGSIPMELHQAAAPKAVAELTRLATAGGAARLHRAEPHPPPGSMGPPYALVQFSIEDGAAFQAIAHEGNAKIQRGSVCKIGGASDVFISLAKHGEHDGWEASMTVLGVVPEPALSELVEQKILALPRHDFKHPTYGTVMSMLDKELPCRLTLSS
jgi:cyclophilin family peptidyl-prolyl cis-trans isomerase